MDRRNRGQGAILFLSSLIEGGERCSGFEKSPRKFYLPYLIS